MNIQSIASQPTPPIVTGLRDFCVKPEVLKSSRTDVTWLEVPKPWSSSMEGLDTCWIDIWGEKSCSLEEHFPPAVSRWEPMQSCLKAMKADPETFNAQRRAVEAEPWTLTEMRKALKWLFNCNGKIPLKTCN